MSKRLAIRLGVVGVVLTLAVIIAVFKVRGKRRYSPSCQRAVAATAPWTELSLPGGGRVCASDERRIEIQHLSGRRPDWESAYGSALTAAGFARDRCTDASCTFRRGDKDKVTLQVIQTSKWNTVIVRK